MTVYVEWLPNAILDYYALPETLQAHALKTIDKIIANPEAGWYAHHTTHQGRPVAVRTFPGGHVIVEFYWWGRFRRNLTIYIYAVRPMDWPGWEEYEERLQQ